MDYALTSTETRTTSSLLKELGADVEACKAVWYGYPQATFVPSGKFNDEVEITAPMIRVYGETDCMADALRVVIDELRAADDCTCTFGYEGGFQLSAILQDGCQKKGQPTDLGLLRDLAPVMSTFALCGTGRAMGKAVMQALELFPDEIGAHFEKRQCPTSGCAAFQTFHILVSKCTGCTKCLDACEDGAIMGKSRFVHVVDQGKCTQCARCQDACPEGAVVRAGAKKPKTPPRPIPVRR